LPKKQQGFWIRKISSDRLSKNNYNLKLDFDEARANGEIVTLSDCQVLRSLRKLTDKQFDPDEFSRLIQSKKKIKRKKDTPENREELRVVEQKIQDLLYTPEIVDILFIDNRHYKKAIESGLWIDGYKYKRLLVSAGMARRNVVMWIREELEKPLKIILNCDRSKDFKIVQSKFSSYFGLYSSATRVVSTPKFVVIPDYEYKKIITVDYMTDKLINCDYQMETREIESVVSCFDGQGLVSPEQSYFWSAELDLSWTPATWIFRMPFGKGQLVTFDFHELAREHNKSKVVDVWGKEHNIFDVEVLVSSSQFKLSQAFESCEQYVRNCEKNDLTWGISRYAPERTKTFSFSTYQFLQNLNITSDAQIENLCRDTVDWIKKVSGSDYRYSILFLLGDLANTNIDSDSFDAITDPILKSLILEPELIKISYIKEYISHLINKKIRESYMGVILINGSNYQTLISDPLAQAEHALGMEVKGILSSGENYSNYWNKKGIDRISTLRAPMIWHSENNIIDLKNDKQTRKYYKYLYDGIVFNIYDDSAAKMSGADFDGDLAQSLDQKEFIECAYNDRLISYDRKTATKKVIIEDELWSYDTQSFNSKIGFITNVSTFYHSLLPLFDKNSEEHKTILNRLKLIFCWQSMEIDKTKGIQTLPFPKHWTKWTKINKDMSEDEKKEAEFNNQLIADKHPYFFRWLYQFKNSKYLNHRNTYENYCQSKFGYGIDNLLRKNDPDENEKRIREYYIKYSSLVVSDCTMNKISHYMENKIKEIKINSQKNKVNKFILDKDFIIDNEKFDQLRNIYLQYKSFRTNKQYGDDYSSLDHFILMIQKQAYKISSDGSELAVMSLELDTKFAFQVFGEQIVEYLMDQKGGIMNIPVEDEKGKIDYLGKRYSFITRKLLME
jgi:hypothetical protein